MNLKDQLKYLKQNENLIHIIHFSCENLSDNNDNYSPRITSIVIVHISSKLTHSFSMHLTAEEIGIERDQITNHYNQIEQEMLSNFYDFVKEHSDALWIHWNMSNVNYGFETIAHRYKVLTKLDAPKIDDRKKFNISHMILDKYGRDCVDHPRMKHLMELNGGIHRDVLLGVDEVKAFENQEYIKLHKSTIAKSKWFEDMYRLLIKNKIKTTRTNWLNRINSFVEHPLIKLLGFIAVLYTIIDIIMKAFKE